MAFENWEKQNGDGIVAQPLLGFEAAAAPGHALLRVRYATSQETLDKGVGQHLQLAMTAVQARELARALTELAERIDQVG